MTDAIADEQAPAIIEQSQAVSFAIGLDEFKENLALISKVVHEYLIEGEDWGKIPGTPKPTLLKPGAEKLCDLYGFSQTFEVTHRIEDWNRPSLTGEGTFPFIHYEVRCDLLRRSDGRLVSSGVGACSSMEAKYRWRNDKLACPDCGKELRRSKQAEEYYCWAKQGGCGSKFPLSLAADRQLGKIENPDIADQVNTILKMASKRALIDATLHATRSSGLLTQDVEDMAPADAPFVEGSYREVTEDAGPDFGETGSASAPSSRPATPPSASPANPVNGTAPMTDKQKEYIFGGGAQPLDACLRVKWHTHMGGLAGVQKAIADKTIPDAILAIINYKTDGSLSWRTNLTEQEASDAITAFKDVLNVGDKKDPTATLKAFWAFCNQIGVSKDDVHMFYRVPLDDGALKDYVKERAGDLKTTQMAVWSLMRTEVEKAHAENKLHVAPEETAGQPADIPFG